MGGLAFARKRRLILWRRGRNLEVAGEVQDVGENDGGGGGEGGKTVTQKAFSRLSRSFVDFYTEDVNLSSLRRLYSRDGGLDLHLQLAAVLVGDGENSTKRKQRCEVLLKEESGEWTLEGSISVEGVNSMDGGKPSLSVKKIGESTGSMVQFRFWVDDDFAGSMEISAEELRKALHRPFQLLRDGAVVNELFVSSTPLLRGAVEATIIGDFNCLI